MADLDLLVAAGVRRASATKLLGAIGAGRALSNLTATELVGAGVPVKTAKRIESAIAIGRRVLADVDVVDVCNPADVAEILRARIAGLAQEVFYVLAVDVHNRLIGEPIEVARGNVCGVEVHPREVFRAAMRAGAAGIILAHNHPSGDPTPSSEDVALTRHLVKVGKLTGIPVLDHVVVCAGDHRSIAEWVGEDFNASGDEK